MTKSCAVVILELNFIMNFQSLEEKYGVGMEVEVVHETLNLCLSNIWQMLVGKLTQ